MSPLNRLALAPGFNPQSLPDVAPPVPESRPWRWLAERAADSAEHEAYRAAYRANSRDGRAAPEPTELQAYLARFVAGFGTVDPTDRMVVLQPRPAERVIASHLAQDVVFDFDGAPLVTVRLSAASPDESEGSFPFAGPVAIVGTIPPSRCAVQALGRNLRRELQSHLDGCGIRHLRAVAVDSGRRWLEDALIVDYADGEQVRFAARLFLQPYLTVWRWQDGRSILEVVDLAEWPAERVVASGHASLGRLGHRPCPLIPGAGSADLCQMHGGPWVSRSIRAASRWEDKRSRMLAAVGCDTCGDGAVKVFCGRPLRVVQGGRNTHRVRLDEGVQSRHDELVGTDDEADGSRPRG
jgi:hypothetical protein